VRGELAVETFSEAPDRFAPGRELCVVTVRGGRWLATVTGARDPRGRLLLSLSGCETRAEADALRGAQLTIHPEMRAPLPDHTYYHDQLIGLQVVTTAGAPVGIISDILRTGANDVYVTAQALIPATHEVVRAVDLEAGTMTITPIPGLLD
jgi:16S rRNA processing protein RimM